MRVSAVDGFSQVTTSSDPYITSYIGNEGLGACTTCGPASTTGVPGYTPRSVLDRPYRRDNSGLGVARGIGYVMGIDALADAKPNDPQNLILVRATNLAALTAAWLLQFKPEARLRALEDVTGVAWAQDVLKLANNIPGGGIGISDAVRFSLGLHFLKGLLESERKEDTPDSRGYLTFAALFLDAEKELGGGSKSQLNGLGALGECGRFDLICKAKEAASAVADAARRAASKVVSAVKSAGNKIKEGIDKVANAATDILCDGLKSLPVIGPVIGGAICWIIQKGIDTIANTLTTIVEIIQASITSLATFFTELVSGNVMKAVMALMSGVTEMVFLLFAPVAVTFLYPGAERKKGFAEIKEIAKKVSKKNPFFPLSLTFGIIGVVQAAAGGSAEAAARAAAAQVTGKGGEPNALVIAISTLVIALAPAISVVLAKPLKLIPLLKDFAIEKIETGVEKFIKIGLVVFNGFLALADILPRLRKSVEVFLQKKGGVGGAIKAAGSSAMDNLSKQWDKIAASFKSLKFNEMSAGLTALLSLVPSIIGGMFEDVNNEIPEINETIKAVKEAEVSVEKQEAALTQAQADFVKALPQGQRRAIVMQQATQLQPQQAGITTARLIKEAFANAQNKQAFILAFRAEFANPVKV